MKMTSRSCSGCKTMVSIWPCHGPFSSLPLCHLFGRKPEKVDPYPASLAINPMTTYLTDPTGRTSLSGALHVAIRPSGRRPTSAAPGCASATSPARAAPARTPHPLRHSDPPDGRRSMEEANGADRTVPHRTARARARDARHTCSPSI